MSFVAPYSLALCGVLLVAAAVDHLARPRQFAWTVATHAPLPTSAVLSVAVVVGAIELVIGAAALLAATTTVGPHLPAVAAGVMFFAYAAYLAVLARFRPGSTCGCAGPEAPAGAATIARAGICALLALAPALTPAHHGSAIQLVVVFVAGTASAVLLLVGPAALTPAAKVEWA